MAKKEEDVRTRLQAAALSLFAEHGYERTTAAEIAARAGVTERTFFRYFPDKREVLFDGEAILRKAMAESIATAPPKLAPLDTLRRAFLSLEPMLEGNRAYAKPRHAVIRANPALREREVAKIHVLADALAGQLCARGVSELRATLAAHSAMTAFVQATVDWLDDPEPGLGTRIDLAFRELGALWASSHA